MAAGFETAPRGCRIYETPGAVLEPASLLGDAARGAADRGPGSGAWIDQSGLRTGVDPSATGGGSRPGVAVVLRRVRGTRRCSMAGADGAALMQRRPLHQLVAVGDALRPERALPAAQPRQAGADRDNRRAGGPCGPGTSGAARRRTGVGRSAETRSRRGRPRLRSACLGSTRRRSNGGCSRSTGRRGGRPDGKRPSEAVAVWADGSGERCARGVADEAGAGAPGGGAGARAAPVRGVLAF
jgi:hypothetical protein